MEGDREKDEIMGKERPFLQNRVPVVQVASAEESAEALTLFWNEVGEHVLRDVLGYDVKRQNGGHMERRIMSIARLDARMATAVRYLVGNEKHG